jgi:hypothetical protein
MSLMLLVPVPFSLPMSLVVDKPKKSRSVMRPYCETNLAGVNCGVSRSMWIGVATGSARLSLMV